MAPEDRSDLADHARLVPVADDDEGALERRFHLDAVEPHQARPFRFEHGALGPQLAVARAQLQRQEAGEVPRARAPRLDDLQTALPGDGAGVDERDRLRQHLSEQADEGGAHQHFVRPVGELPVVPQSHAGDAALRELGQEAAETLGEHEVRAQAAELVGSEGRIVDRVAGDPRPEVLPDAGGRLESDEPLGLGRRPSDVRRRDHLPHAGEGGVGRRLLPEDVEPGAGEAALGERLDEGRLVHQVAPRGVDDARAGAAARQPRAVQDSPGRRRRRQVQGDEVRPLDQGVQRDELDAEIVRHLGCDERVVGEHRHVERARAPHDLAPDAAEAGHAERLAAQLDAAQALLAPLSGLHLRVGEGDRAGRGEHEREDVLGDADAVRAGRVQHEDAAGAGGFDVDVVDAGAGARDHPQARRGGQHFGGDRRGAADDEGVGVGKVGPQLRRGAAGARVDGPALGLEQRDGGRGERVRNHDLHGFLDEAGAAGIGRA